MKNTAKTLTLTAKKAPAKTTAQLSVPKTATSYFLETEAAAKVTVVKTRSRLASLKAVQAESEQPEQFDEAVAVGAAEAEAVAAEVAQAEPADVIAAETDAVPAQVAQAAPPVIVKKRSRLAALKADAEPAAAPAVEQEAAVDRKSVV